MTSWQEFLQRAKPIAEKENFPFQVLASQAAIETGRDPNNAPGNNWFGIKGGNGPLLNTEEVSNGIRYKTRAQFQEYGSPEEAVHGYINLIKTVFPQAYALKSNPEAMVRAIAQGGYATNPQYAEDVLSTPEFQTGTSQTAPSGKNIKLSELTQSQPGFQNLFAPQAQAAEVTTPLDRPNVAPGSQPSSSFEGPILANAPGMQEGGWYGGKQFWGGQLGAPGQIINPGQIGFGNVVSNAVMAQTNPGNAGYIQRGGGGLTNPLYQNYAMHTPSAPSRPAMNYSPVRNYSPVPNTSTRNGPVYTPPPQQMNYSPAPNTSTRSGPVYTPPPADHLVSPVYQRNFTPVPTYSPVPSRNIQAGGGLEMFA